ncbi:unnamed protein product [Fusarium graminearum]|uniref:Chromosome 2, complete genome n=1 Tax=Gibberella zeae (strain ATCC MYA-4620 / CBS 123657 / FGSC 9075 / NRRL 31084 / PH-1) TaxID=229533 RepID=A0A098DBB6_GIBZE|nr:unnamed protein product [Fusarium graminearum]
MIIAQDQGHWLTASFTRGRESQTTKAKLTVLWGAINSPKPWYDVSLHETGMRMHGFTCRSAVHLWLYLENENEKFSGPTEGKKKINARRVSRYKIVRR